MPDMQTAALGNYDFGAPVATATVLQFRVKNGGKVHLLFENADGVADGTVSVEVSPDDSAWNATTAQNNGEAVTSQVVQRGTNKDFTVNLRASVDLFMRVRASGGCRMAMQVRDEAGLEVVQI